MRRLIQVLLLASIAFPLTAQSLRGPVVAELSVTPISAAASAEFGIEEIVLLRPEGDSRFYDAVEIEITVPSVISDFPGALALTINTVGTMSERAGVVDINGARIVSQPLSRTGKSFIQIPMRSDAATNASAAVMVLDNPVHYDEFPVALTVVPLMKGLPESVAGARIQVVMSSVTRAIGAAAVTYTLEDGSEFQVESLRAPEFALTIDGERIEVAGEYLLQPGLHRVALTSETYQDQEITFGIERGVVTPVSLPLLPALATITYTAPRGARVYVDGSTLAASSGDFTAPPGEHTIVVVVGDYTVTRRFSVLEGRTYNLSITMDIVVEETK